MKNLKLIVFLFCLFFLKTTNAQLVFKRDTFSVEGYIVINGPITLKYTQSFLIVLQKTLAGGDRLWLKDKGNFLEVPLFLEKGEKIQTKPLIVSYPQKYILVLKTGLPFFEKQKRVVCIQR